MSPKMYVQQALSLAEILNSKKPFTIHDSVTSSYRIQCHEAVHDAKSILDGSLDSITPLPIDDKQKFEKLLNGAYNKSMSSFTSNCTKEY